MAIPAIPLIKKKINAFSITPPQDKTGVISNILANQPSVTTKTSTSEFAMKYPNIAKKMEFPVGEGLNEFQKATAQQTLQKEFQLGREETASGAIPRYEFNLGKSFEIQNILAKKAFQSTNRPSLFNIAESDALNPEEQALSKEVAKNIQNAVINSAMGFGGLKRDVMGGIGKGIAKEVPIFAGFKDLTTKFLNYAKGKSTLSKQEIVDFARRPELKKGEADLLLKKLEEFEPKNIQMIKINSLPERATAIGMPRNEFDVLAESIKREGIKIPIIIDKKTGQVLDGQHRAFVAEELGIKEIPAIYVDKTKLSMDDIRGLNKKLMQPKLPAQEFADSLRRDLLELKPVKVKNPEFENTTIDSRDVTPTELAGYTETKPEVLARRGKNYEEVVFESPITTNGSSHYPNSKNYFAHARGDEVVEGGKNIWREQEIQSDLLQKDNFENKFRDVEDARFFVNRGEEAPSVLQEAIEGQKQKGQLQPFTNDRFGGRIMRERIKEKAQKGYEKYRLPTGNTIARIEGFEPNMWFDASKYWSSNPKALEPIELKVGMEVNQTAATMGDEWIITDVLDNGRFKAIPKNSNELTKAVVRSEFGVPGGAEAMRKFYFKPGREVPSYGGGVDKVIEYIPGTQNRSWKVKVKELGDYEIRTHSTEPEIKNVADVLIKEGKVNWNNITIPPQLTETFDLTSKSNPQYIRYENWGKFLKNKYGGKLVTDPQGNSWWEIDLKPEYKKVPIEAFGALPLMIQQSQKKKEDGQGGGPTTMASLLQPAGIGTTPISNVASSSIIDRYPNIAKKLKEKSVFSITPPQGTTPTSLPIKPSDTTTMTTTPSVIKSEGKGVHDVASDIESALATQLIQRGQQEKLEGLQTEAEKVSLFRNIPSATAETITSAIKKGTELAKKFTKEEVKPYFQTLKEHPTESAIYTAGGLATGVRKAATDILSTGARYSPLNILPGYRKQVEPSIKTFKELNDRLTKKMEEGAQGEEGYNRIQKVGEVIGEMAPYFVSDAVVLKAFKEANALAKANGLANLAAKTTKFLGRTGTVASSFVMTGQVLHQPDEGSRVNQMVNDLLMAGAFEVGAYAFSKVLLQPAKAILQKIKEGKPIISDELSILWNDVKVNKGGYQTISEGGEAILPKVKTAIEKFKPLVRQIKESTQATNQYPKLQKTAKLEKVYKEMGDGGDIIKRADQELSPTEINPQKAGLYSSFKKTLENKKTNFIEYVQDNWRRVRELMNQPDVKITEATNPYEKEILFHGRVQARINEGVKIAEDINKKIQEVSQTSGRNFDDIVSEVNDFLVANHAPERNAQLGEKAAGITTEEANKIVARIKDSPLWPQIKEVTDDIMNLNKKTLETLRDGGVITQKLYDDLTTKYTKHVPLNRIFDETENIDTVLTSRGFDVWSTGLKRAKGSEREVDDILKNVLANYDQAVMRSEKNIVDNATLQFARENSHLGVFEEVKPPQIPVAKVTHKEAIDVDFFDKVINFAKSLGAKVSTKGQPGRRLGYFQAPSDVVRKVATPREVLSHEVGHFFDNKFDLKKRFFKRGESKEVAEEMIAWMKEIGESQNRIKNTKERFADSFEWWLTNRALAEESLPLFSKEMERIIKDIPELKPLLDIKPSGKFTVKGIQEIIFRPSAEKLIHDPTILSLRENGNPVYLKIEDPNLAVALKGINQEKLRGFFKGVRVFTRFYAGMATRYNPEFALPNKIRDLQEMIVYTASQKDMGFKSGLKATAKDIKLRNAKDILDYMRDVDSEGAKLYKQMMMDGGTTGGMALSTKKQVKIDVEKMRKLARSKPRQATQELLKIIDNWNTLFEDSTRLSVYRTALEQGSTRQRAAVLAKESTINFNKFGKGGPVINALWMFSNASIQGSAKMLRAMKNPRVAATVVGTIGVGVTAVNEWNNSVDSKWRDGVSKWDQLNALNVVIPTDALSEKLPFIEKNKGITYISIPVSWGLKPLKVMWDYAYAIAENKGQDLEDMASAMLTAFLEAYNPIGGTDIISALTPTILDLPVDWGRNRQWSGSKIKPDLNWNNKFTPSSIRYFSNLNDTTMGKLFIKLTDKISEKTGTRIEISPADINYIFNQSIGGAGRTGFKFLNTLNAIGTDDKVIINDIPFISRFLRHYEEETIRGTSKIFEELKKVYKGRAKEDFSANLDAENMYEELKKMPPDQAYEVFEDLRFTYPDVAKKINKIIDEEEKNLSADERLINGLGVENGDRANFIYGILQETPEDEKYDVYQNFIDKGIVTKKVDSQITDLLSQ